MSDWLEVTLRSLGVGFAAVAVEFPIAVLLARPLARREFAGRSFVQALLLTPMFLPPVTVGFLLLLLLRPDGVLGGLGSSLLYEPGAAVLAAAIISFPILLRHAQEAFAAVPERLLHVSNTLGAGGWRTFWRVDLPLARRGLAVGALLAFARGIGEFGATSIIAGVSPGKTETIALRIDRMWKLGEDDQALAFAWISVALGFAAVFASEWLLRRNRREAKR